MTPHRQPIPEPASRGPDTRPPAARSGTGPREDQLVQLLADAGEPVSSATPALGAGVARARCAAEPISVEQLERDDGAPVVYIDALDIAVFIYVGDGDDPDAVVLDTYRRTDAAQRRLNVLLDGARARLLTLDPTRFHLLGPDTPSRALLCGRCGGRLRGVRGVTTLGGLLDLATSHRCPADPDQALTPPDRPGDEPGEVSWS
jgi:hypothetical protein